MAHTFKESLDSFFLRSFHWLLHNPSDSVHHALQMEEAIIWDEGQVKRLSSYLSYNKIYSKQPIFGLTQEWFRELSISRLECGVQDRLHIHPLCGIFHVPWHRHQIEVSPPKDRDTQSLMYRTRFLHLI